MTHTSNTFTGANGKFTGVYYKRNGGWFGGVWNRQTGKREYGSEVNSAWAAATVAAQTAERLAGADATMDINFS